MTVTRTVSIIADILVVTYERAGYPTAETVSLNIGPISLNTTPLWQSFLLRTSAQDIYIPGTRSFRELTVDRAWAWDFLGNDNRWYTFHGRCDKHIMGISTETLSGTAEQHTVNIHRSIWQMIVEDLHAVDTCTLTDMSALHQYLQQLDVVQPTNIVCAPHQQQALVHVLHTPRQTPTHHP